MQVKELIEILKKMPPDAQVIYYDGDNGWCTPRPEFITEYSEFVYSSKTRKIKGKFVDLTAD